MAADLSTIEGIRAARTAMYEYTTSDRIRVELLAHSEASINFERQANLAAKEMALFESANRVEGA